MLVITAVLLVVAVSGYLVPSGSEPVPTRLLFDTAGGKVVLTHSAHNRDYGADCARCHHHGPDGAAMAEAMDGAEPPLACSTCHPAAFDEAFVREHVAAIPNPETCADCHHARMKGLAFAHDRHVDILADDCRACHHDIEIESAPSACSDCHAETGDASMPSLQEAGHDRCSDCHEELAPEAMACRTCHSIEDTAGNKISDPTPCGRCHVSPQIPLPTRTDAFHGQCMGCHQENGRGPFGDESCDQCHFR